MSSLSFTPERAGSFTPIRVGIAGLGRSGWDIHARVFSELSDRYVVVAVMDLDAGRCADAVARFGCRAYGSFEDLVEDEAVEVIVVATPSFLHANHTVAALMGGKHVVCEKPFGQNTAEAARMIAAATQAKRLLAPFHNRRYEAHLLKVREVIESGLLGEIQLIRICWHTFKRRSDWQTLTQYGGGNLCNTGSHILDHALQLLGPVKPRVTVDLRNVLSSGDAEDHFKVLLQAEGAPLIEVELSGACAYPQDRWLIVGDAGGLRGDTTRLEWKWVDWPAYAPCPVDREAPQDRAYPHDALDWQNDRWEGTDDLHVTSTEFFVDFYRSVREGQPLVITAESAYRNIALIKECKRLGTVRQGRFSLQKSARAEAVREPELVVG